MKKIKKLYPVSKQKKLFTLIIGLLLIGAVSVALFRQGAPTQKQAEENAIKQLDSGDYSAAAQSYIDTYNRSTDPSVKANSASDAGFSYSSDNQYEQAEVWYQKAYDQYQAAGDKEGAAEAQTLRDAARDNQSRREDTKIDESAKTKVQG